MDPPATPPQRRSWPRRLLNRMEVDQAVFFAVLSRGWQFVAGPVTIVLIANFFSEEVQGYYYTFWGLMGIQMFFELGFPQAIINTASHEWDKLSLNPDGSIGGDPAALSRLMSLFRAAWFSYGVIAVAFWIAVSVAGLIFFSFDKDSEVIAWRAPWLALAALTSLAFWLTPPLTLLEGCNQVKSVYQLQFARSVLGNVAVWACIPLGTGLWTPVVATLVRLACELFLLLVPYRRFFATFLHKPPGPTMNWRTEVWPFQWRIALKGLFGYFNAYLMNPVVFHYHGSVAAGQVGMTWQVLSSLQAACGSWVKTRVARMGMLVSRGDYRELDRMFFRVSGIALGVMFLGCLAFWLLDWGLHWIASRYATRLMAPLPTAVLAVGMLSALVTEFQWTYIHAHHRSPYLLLTILNAIANGLLIWWWGAWYGGLGVAAALLVMNVFFNLPVWTYVWLRCREEWHAEA
jgi:O-antigen/teichoic acid export membrane protein